MVGPAKNSANNKEANNRMKIELGGDWGLYVKALPQGWRALGVVDLGEDGEVDPGALVVDARQTYFQLNGMLIRSLDQASVSRMMVYMAG
jgi:hypothetical protein